MKKLKQPLSNGFFVLVLFGCNTKNDGIDFDTKYFHSKSNYKDYIVFYENGKYLHVIEDIDYKKVASWELDGNNLYLKKFITVVDPCCAKIDTNNIGTYNFLLLRDKISQGEEIEYFKE